MRTGLLVFRSAPHDPLSRRLSRCSGIALTSVLLVYRRKKT